MYKIYEYTFLKSETKQELFSFGPHITNNEFKKEISLYKNFSDLVAAFEF